MLIKGAALIEHNTHKINDSTLQSIIKYAEVVLLHLSRVYPSEAPKMYAALSRHAHADQKIMTMTMLH